MLAPLLLVTVTAAVTLIVVIMPSAFSSPISSFYRDKNGAAAAAGEQQDRDDDVPHELLHVPLPSLCIPFRSHNRHDESCQSLILIYPSLILLLYIVAPDWS